MTTGEDPIGALVGGIFAAARAVSEPVQAELAPVDRAEQQATWVGIAFEALSFYTVLATRVAQTFGVAKAQHLVNTVARLLLPLIETAFLSRNPPEQRAQVLEAFGAGHHDAEVDYGACARVLPSAQGADSMVTRFATRLAVASRQAPDSQKQQRIASIVLAAVRDLEQVVPFGRLVSEACAALPPEADAGELVATLRQQAIQAVERGDVDAALEHAQEAVRQAGHAGLPLVLAGSLELVGDMLTRRGEVAQARGPYAEALTLYRSLKSDVGAANVELSLGELHHRSDDWATARQHFLAALDGYQRAGRKRGASQAQLGLGRVAFLQGDRKQALRCFGAALEGLQGVDDARGVAQAQLAMAQALTEDEPSRGAELLRAALGSFLALEDPLGIANAHRALGRAQELLGDSPGAEDHFEEARVRYRAVRAHLGEAEALASLGELRLARNEPSGALDAFRRAEEAAERAGSPGKVGWMRFRAACSVGAQGRFAEAIAAGRSARELLEASEQQHLLPELDEWLTQAERAVAGVPCPCGSGAPFVRCHGVVD